MALVDVRRLAALDMHGLAGTRRRRRLILAEFVVGALACIVVGLSMATRSTGAEWRVVGAWLAGVGVNYAVLAFHAFSLSRPGALDVELAGVDVGPELRRHTYLQAWILVPSLLVALAVRQIRHRPAPPHRPG
jgi:hypothetical protein